MQLLKYWNSSQPLHRIHTVAKQTVTTEGTLSIILSCRITSALYYLVTLFEFLADLLVLQVSHSLCFIADSILVWLNYLQLILEFTQRCQNSAHRSSQHGCHHKRPSQWRASHQIHRTIYIWWVINSFYQCMTIIVDFRCDLVTTWYQTCIGTLWELYW